MLKHRLNAYRISTKFLVPEVNILQDYANSKEGNNVPSDESTVFKLYTFKGSCILFVIVTFKLWSTDKSENPQRFIRELQRVTKKPVYS